MTIAENRRARFDYEIGQTFEAGLVLTGSEVKALRAGRASIAEAYVGIDGSEAWLVNSHVDLMPGTKMGVMDGHEPRRRRKLLLRSREIAAIGSEIGRGGMTAVPLSLFFNERGTVKLSLALGRGRKAQDKRAAIKEREWKRDKARLMASRG